MAEVIAALECERSNVVTKALIAIIKAMPDKQDEIGNQFFQRGIAVHTQELKRMEDSKGAMWAFTGACTIGIVIAIATSEKPRDSFLAVCGLGCVALLGYGFVCACVGAGVEF